MSRAQTVGVAIVGAGFGARVQLPIFASVPGVRVHAVVGRDLERTRRAVAAQGLGAVATTDLAAAIDDSRVDLVSIATPPSSHAEPAAAALEAGKHVLCEKPFTVTIAEAEALAGAAVRARSRLALVDHQMRFAVGVQRLQRLLADGYAGTPLHAAISVATPRELDRARPFEWWHDRARGGGALGAYGSHAVDLVRFLFGEIDGVRGALDTFVGERLPEGALRAQRVDADDWAALWLACGRIRVTVEVSAVAMGGGGLRLEVFGEAGMLALDTEGTLRGRREGGGLEALSEPAALPAALRGAVADSPWTVAFAAFASRLADAIAAGEPTLPGAATFADGLAVQRALDAARADAAIEGARGLAAGPPST